MTPAHSQVIPSLLRAIAGTVGDVLILTHQARTAVALTAIPSTVPALVLAALEREDQVHVGLATRDAGHQPARQLAVAFVHVPIRAAYLDGSWQRPETETAAAVARLQAAAIPPAWILLGSTRTAGAGWRVTGIWPIRPLDLTTPAGLADARALLEALAGALDGEAPDEDPTAWVLELPGSRMREFPHRREFAGGLEARGGAPTTYTADALRAALTHSQETV